MSPWCLCSLHPCIDFLLFSSSLPSHLSHPFILLSTLSFDRFFLTLALGFSGFGLCKAPWNGVLLVIELNWMNTYIVAYTLTMTVAPCCFHEPVVLVIACHGLIAIALSTLLDICRNFQSQDIVQPVSLRQDAVRPVAHRPGIVLVTGTVLGLAQRVHLGVFAFVFLFTPPWEAHRSWLGTVWFYMTYSSSRLMVMFVKAVSIPSLICKCSLDTSSLFCSHLSMSSFWCGPPHSRLYRRRTWTSWSAGSHPGRAADMAAWCAAWPW